MVGDVYFALATSRRHVAYSETDLCSRCEQVDPPTNRDLHGIVNNNAFLTTRASLSKCGTPLEALLRGHDTQLRVQKFDEEHQAVMIKISDVEDQAPKWDTKVGRRVQGLREVHRARARWMQGPGEVKVRMISYCNQA